jgi:cyclic pyranopterin phosphate synthase
MNAIATSSLTHTRAGRPLPTYLRVVVTTTCNYACSFCHMEGDPHAGGARELDTATLCGLLEVALEAGVRKIKFLGGEPLLRRDLPEVVAHVRRMDAGVDLSVITAGAVPTRILDSLYLAGLSRCNVSVHDFGADEFARRSRAPQNLTRRNEFLEHAIAWGRPLKLNYVYTGESDLPDIAALLDWARGRGVTIGLLDDLGQELGPQRIAQVAEQLLGRPHRIEIDRDPHSLPTTHWLYEGLRLEIKTARLGEEAPWLACQTCSRRAKCSEGIYALRLTHRGALRPCMDRPDLGVDLADTLLTFGPDATLAQWQLLTGAL